MISQEIEKELLKILTETIEIQYKSELEESTVKFLRQESAKLILEMENKDLSKESIEILINKSNSLIRRMQVENEMIVKGQDRLTELTNRIEYLKNLSETL